MRDAYKVLCNAHADGCKLAFCGVAAVQGEGRGKVAPTQMMAKQLGGMRNQSVFGTTAALLGWVHDNCCAALQPFYFYLTCRGMHGVLCCSRYVLPTPYIPTPPVAAAVVVQVVGSQDASAGCWQRIAQRMQQLLTADTPHKPESCSGDKSVWGV